LCRPGFVSLQTRCRRYGPGHHLAPTGGAVSALEIHARWSLDRRAVRRLSWGRLERELRHVGTPSSGMQVAVGAQRCSWVRRDRPGSVRRSRPCPGPRSSPRALTGGPPSCPPRREHRGREGHTPAVSGTGSTSARSGVAPGRVRLLAAPWRCSWPRHRSRVSGAPPRILRYPHLGFSLPSRRIRCLNGGSSGGRPGGREPRPLLLLSRSRCHRVSVSGPTRKLFHRLRDRTRATAARNARSAMLKRTRLPPRRRTLGGGA
jgi:hypothetical protein